MDIRIKADEGESGLVNSLSVTSMAAPAALPDLIALSRPALETAALKGLLHPLDGLSNTLDDSNWYEYARQLGRIQNTGYGLPFAGDALVLVYRSEVERINSWNDVLASENPLVFAVGDPKALVGLALYVSAGGELLDAQGQPTLDQDILTRILTSIADGALAGVFSPSLDNLVSNEQVLQAYLGERANMAIIWASDYRAPEGQFTLPLPGLDETSDHLQQAGYGRWRGQILKTSSWRLNSQIILSLTISLVPGPAQPVIFPPVQTVWPRAKPQLMRSLNRCSRFHPTRCYPCLAPSCKMH